MDFGCFLPNVPPILLKDIAVKADSLGFDCLWGSDHLMSPFPPAIPDFPERLRTAVMLDNAPQPADEALSAAEVAQGGNNRPTL